MTVVVDANCFSRFVKSILSGVNDEYTSLFENIFIANFLSFDDEKLIYQEWIDSTGGFGNIFVSDLLASWEQTSKVRYFEYLRYPVIKKDLGADGVPKKDIRMIEFAFHIKSKVVASEDMDLYDPKQKICSPKVRERLVRNRMGCICRKIHKKYGIVVCDSVSSVDYI